MSFFTHCKEERVIVDETKLSKKSNDATVDFSELIWGD